MIHVNDTVPRAASALLAAALTLTLLAAFLQPGAARLRPPLASAAGATPVFVQPLPAAKAGAEPARLAGGAAGPPAPRAARPGRPRPQETPAQPAGPLPVAVQAEVRAEPAGAAAPPGAPELPRAVPDPAAATAAISSAAPAPARPASAPLRLDRHVLREASRASRSAVQQMAEASGQPAGDGPVGADQRLADSVARTVKPDCLPPGGTHGLFTPLVAAYRMATDTCRNR